MKKNVFKLTFLLTLFSNAIFAQTESNETSAINAIYVSGGSIFVYSSANLNYDHRIKQSENAYFFKNYYATLNAGVFNLNTGLAPGPSSNGFTTGIGVIGLTGKGNGHFETGLGLSLNIETKIKDGEKFPDREKMVFVLPELSLGYRYQKANGFIFRSGLGYPHIIYLSVGYSFL